MTRRNAFDHLRQTPQQPISIIPRAQEKRRDNRTWDQTHPVISYYIPAPFEEKAKDIRAVILALSQQHMTTITSVAIAFVSYSLAHVRQGKLKIVAQPNPRGRKMTVTWEEASEGWPQEIQQPVTPGKKQKTKEFYLGFRWGRDVDRQIKALADKSIAVGEIVVFLLSYAVQAHKKGKLRLKEETVVVAQKVSAIW